MRTILYGLVILLALVPPVFGTTIYKWVDNEGVPNFTDNPKKIPSAYRDRVVTEVFEETSLMQPSVRPQSTAKTDRYGRSETWWKEKVQPWKRELDEATTNYERVNQKFIGEAEALSRMRYGSQTQLKMKIIELDRTNDERTRYKEQIGEARQALEKLAREAEESEADPAWLD